jgi:hypothetical protein
MSKAEGSGRAPRNAAALWLGPIALVAALAAAWGILRPSVAQVPELIVAEPNGRALASFRPQDGRFEHVFVHSVHLTPVEELFQIEPEKNGKARLRLYELRYESSGVGMPADAEGGYKLEGGKFILSMNRSFDAIPLRVSIVPGHGIVVDGKLHPFTDWAAPESPLVLRAQIVRVLQTRR